MTVNTMYLNIHLLLVLIIAVFPMNDVYAITDSDDVKNISIDEKLGEAIPGDIVFVDENLTELKFKDAFSLDKPIILNLAYYSCPRICNYGTDGLLQVLNELDAFSLGKDFKVFTASFDPDDSAEIAKTKALKYRELLENGQATKSNWPFLVSDDENINKLTQAVGFKYLKDGEEYAHPSALIVLTPDGTISRYLYGIQHEPSDLRLVLLEASKGEIGSSKVINQVLLFCYGFDPIGKRYALKALNVVKAGGVVTLLSLCGVLTFLWRRERKDPE